MKNVVIRDKTIGDGHPPYFVAELGICHQGSVEIAIELVDACSEAGVDCIKTETFQREKIVFDSSMTTSYSIGGEKITENLAEHMDRYELTFDEHAQVKDRAEHHGLPFMATAHDFESIDFLADIGADAVKITSADIIHYPLIRHAARTDLILFMDTGGAQQYEIERGVKTALEASAKGVVVNHHPGGHPASAEQYNLRIIPHLQLVLGVPVGTADHYDGYEMVYGATAVGANVIEKPVSRDRFIPEPEHIWAVSTADLKGVIQGMHSVFKGLGEKERKGIKPSSNRVSLVAKTDLPMGSILNFDNIMFGRPTKGICVEHWDLVEGRKLIKSKAQGEFITWDDI